MLGVWSHGGCMMRCWHRPIVMWGGTIIVAAWRNLVGVKRGTIEMIKRHLLDL